jgi:hypothetical protein
LVACLLSLRVGGQVGRAHAVDWRISQQWSVHLAEVIETGGLQLDINLGLQRLPRALTSRRLRSRSVEGGGCGAA